MDDLGTKTRQEILSQPDVWASVLDTTRDRGSDLREAWVGEQYENIVFTGCGSTYYLALSAATTLAQLTGKVCRAVPASELLLYPEAVYPSHGKTLLIAVSRSGETTETVKVAKSFVQQGRGTLVTFSCYPEQPLAQLGSLNIVLPDAQEESVVQTRAFSSLLLATTAAAASWAERDDLMKQLDQLPSVSRRLMDEHLSTVTEIATTSEFTSCYFLGSGPQYGLACEASLKMKEMALTPSEPFHFLEVRHGPKSIIGPSMLVVGLYSRAHLAIERDVMIEAESLGGQTFTLGAIDADLSFGNELDEAVSSVLYLPPIQWLAAERASQRGIDPDHPKNLDTVVRLQMS